LLLTAGKVPGGRRIIPADDPEFVPGADAGRRGRT